MAPMSISPAATLRFGVRFSPSPETAISFYLHRWILGQPLDTAGIIHEAPVYSCAPKELAAKFPRLPKTDDRYFFTTCKRQKAGGKGGRMSRTAGEDSWVSQSRITIMNDAGETIGYCVKLSYGKRTGWLMDEYHCLLEESLVGTEERVFCKIYVSPKKCSAYTAHQESAAGDHRQEPALPMPVQVQQQARQEPQRTMPVQVQQQARQEPQRPMPVQVQQQARQEPRWPMLVQVQQQVRQELRLPVAVHVPVITQPQALGRPPATSQTQSMSSSVQGQRRVMVRPVPVPVFTQPPVPVQVQQQARQEPRRPMPVQVQQQVRQQPRPPVAVPVPVITQQQALRRPTAASQTQSMSSSMQGQRRVMVRPVPVPVFNQLQAPMKMPAPQIAEPPCPKKMHPVVNPVPVAAVIQSQAPKKRPAPPVAEPPCTKKMRPVVKPASAPQLPCPASRQDPLPTPSVPLPPKRFTAPVTGTQPAWIPPMDPALASALACQPILTSPVAAPIEEEEEDMLDVEEEDDGMEAELKRLLYDDDEIEEEEAPIEEDEDDDSDEFASSLEKDLVEATEEDDSDEFARSLEKDLVDATEEDDGDDLNVEEFANSLEKDLVDATEEDDSEELNVEEFASSLADLLEMEEEAAAAEPHEGVDMGMDGSSLEGLLTNEQGGDDVIAEKAWDALKEIGDGEDDADYLSVPLSDYSDKLFY